MPLSKSRIVIFPVEGFVMIAVQQAAVGEGQFEAAAAIADCIEAGDVDIVAATDRKGVHFQLYDWDESIVPTKEGAEGDGIGIVIRIGSELVGIKDAEYSLRRGALAGVISIEREIGVVVDDGF